jgi:glucosamine-6-phosphate deaminase
MTISIYNTVAEMAKAAAATTACELSERVAQKGHATFMAATGTSQLEFLEALSRKPGVDWSKTTMFHLDEYIGLPNCHPASFRHYLQEHLISCVHPGTVHLIDGDAPDPETECERMSSLLRPNGVDVAFVGIGENAHLAFNDPPADFETQASFMVVELTETCRAQQVHEGWFDTVADVPQRAITVTISEILKSGRIICTVPGVRKAQAIKCALCAPVTPSCPASVLRTHPNVRLFLDKGAASLLDEPCLRQYEIEDAYESSRS